MISLLLTGGILLTFLLFLRLLSITPSINPTPPPRRPPSQQNPPHILYNLGSGGHTAELLSLLTSTSTPTHTHLHTRTKRTYTISRGDALSAKKAFLFECSAGSPSSSYEILEIPRARGIGQTWLSTPLSAISCLAGCVRVFVKVGLPDVVVCNGPGSAVLVAGVCFLAKFLGLCKTRIIYVESFARVRSLSLSGKLLYAFADRFVVQWPGLVEKYPRAEFHGILI
ncbi:Alg14-domain-containing protein [Choiromyces venosus 120613-1]|uniref:UDP-N-acetylglucosamine transferase subunit ALG14 n=1 Tax=Choiromyces venosus 120613-1 TaxID=1336337 RepID=A0A3N4K298_9PEZI|nr:Alg14-domain-containing protein [Choiromyces venosus 120613-1]